MSNVKVNGNIYNDVASIKLMKADDSGYAEYREDAVAAADGMLEKLIANEHLGNITREDASPCLEWMVGYTCGTVSFPYATVLKGVCGKITAENLLLPNVASIAAIAAGRNDWRGYGFSNCEISGTLDLSSLESVNNNMTTFAGSRIHTLKLGKYAPSKPIWSSAVITNLVYYGLTPTSGLLANGTNFAAATVTNLYVPADCVETAQAFIDNGAWSKVANVYSIDEWED